MKLRFFVGTNNVVAPLSDELFSAAWGDYDNDGFLDLLVVFSAGSLAVSIEWSRIGRNNSV